MDARYLQDLAAEFPREHVAAACQRVLEIVVCEIVHYWTKRLGVRDVVLAGGVAANVKMNQRISELDGIQRVFVHPAMGDGGTSVGAVLALLLEQGRASSEEWPSCSLGPAYNEEEMLAACVEGDLQTARFEDVAAEIACLLADGRVVARFNGAAEYGPRALGNRSILSQAIDPGINDSLNQRLKRTEFMPFAPVTLYEFRTDRYVDIDRIENSARFMTVTCECSDRMREESPAAVHVDGTARPQLVKYNDNADLHSILSAYHRITGIPTLINTSFNMHEEPMVCTPQDAVRAFKSGKLDVLAMGPFIAIAEPTEAQESESREY